MTEAQNNNNGEQKSNGAVAPKPPTAQPGINATFQVNNVAKTGTSGLAITSLVLGIIAFLCSVLPLLNLLSFPFVILAVIFGAIGLAQTMKGTKGGKGIAIAGLVLGVLALIITIAMYGTAGSSSQNSGTDNQTTVIEETDGSASASAETADQGGSDAKYTVTIDGCKQVKDYAGKDAIQVTYTWTNNSDDAQSFMVAVSDKAFQDGVELETTFLSGDDSNTDKQVKPGTSLEVTQAFVLDNKKSPVTVECEEMFNFSDELLAEKTFNL